MQRREPLTRAECLERLEDVRQRCADGPSWKDKDPRDVFCGENEDIPLRTKNQYARLKELELHKWRMNNIRLAMAMGVQLSWEIER